MPKMILRIVVALVTLILLANALTLMVRLSWEVDAAIAVVAAIAFAYVFERDDPPGDRAA